MSIGPAFSAEQWGQAYQQSLKPVADPYASLSNLRDPAVQQGIANLVGNYDFKPGSVPGSTGVQPQGQPQQNQGEPEDAYTKYLREEQARLERLRSINAVESLRGVMDAYGLGSLMGRIQAWVTDGYEGDAIMSLIRTTPEYKQRFPAMDALAQKGRAISEAEYIAFERNAAQLERAFGLPAGMVAGQDAVTNLLTKEVSAQELEQRVTMAAAGAYQMSPEMKSTFKDYYGIDGGGLTAYFLDPDRAMPLLTRQYVSSAIGAEAAMQDVQIAANTAERLYEFGIDQGEARQGFQQVGARSSFMGGRGETVSQQGLIEGTFGLDQGSAAAIERVGRSRAGAFAGGGDFVAGQGGVSGLGSSGG